MRIATGFFVLAACMPYLVWAVVEIDLETDMHKHIIMCKCPSKYEPVCGSNGITYSNDCVLNCVSNDHKHNGHPEIHPLYSGHCHPLSCNCSNVIKPICGTDNHTYPNDCHLICENVRREKSKLPPIGLAYQGNCKQVSCKCPDSKIPVCGTNGWTYRNLCIMQCYSRINQAHGLPEIRMKSTGACKNDNCKCSSIKKHFCASDGITYINKCAFDCQNRRRKHLGLRPLTVRYPGECINCICTANLDPVCGSDGNTYNNMCLLICENMNRDRVGLPALTVRWRGACNCGCTRQWNPVCDSYKRTWANRCLLDCENKKRELNGQPLLAMLYRGECRRCYCGYCPKRIEPVCGSNRQTYRNNCELKCNNDCRVASGLPPIRKVANRLCKI